MPRSQMHHRIPASRLVVSMAPELLLFSDSLVDRLGYAALLHTDPRRQAVLRREGAERLNQALFNAFCGALPRDRLGQFVQMAADNAPISARVSYLRQHVPNVERTVVGVMLRVLREQLASGGRAILDEELGPPWRIRGAARCPLDGRS